MAGGAGIEVRGPVEGRAKEILTPEALRFVARLQQECGSERATLLKPRTARQAKFDLLDVRMPSAEVTEAGLRGNVSVAIQVLASWLGGVGAVGISTLREAAATAEISRSQVWQWLRRGVRLPDGTPVTRELVRRIEEESS